MAVLAHFVVYGLVVTSLKAKRARVWAPSVHQMAVWAKAGSENPLWATPWAPKSRKTASLCEIACRGGAAVAV